MPFSIQNGIPMGQALLSSEYKIVEANDYLLNHWSSITQGQALVSSVYEQDRVVLEELFDSDPGTEQELRTLVRPVDNPDQWWDLRITESSDGAVVALFTEVTTLIRAQNQLRKERDQAEQATQSKSAFLANMSHEIRTPIHTVTGMSDLLADTNLNPEQGEYVEQIRFAAEVLLGLVNDILDFSKIEAGKLNLEYIPYDLKETAENAVDMLCLEAFRKGLEVVLSIDDQLPIHVDGDPVRFRQILVNLMNNAIKFTAQGEVSIRLSIKRSPDGRENILCEVRDTGIGIPPQKQKRLFKAFSQVDPSTTRQFGGTGLGLSISRSLVKLMGGSIGVKSKEGVGTNFWFMLPLSSSAEQPTREEPDSTLLHDKRYLIVDDNTSVRKALVTMLSRYSDQVYTASNGEEALELMIRQHQRAEPIDVALVDMIMPRIDGAHLASLVRENPQLSETSLVLMRQPGTNPEEAKMRLFQWFDSYLSKPIKSGPLTLALLSSLQRDLEILPEVVDDGRELIGASPAAGGQLNILVAEDHEVNQQLFKTVLEKLGHKVSLASNGSEAVELVQKQNFDVVFMDIHMPVMNGYDATIAIRNMGNGTPIYAVTANALREEREKVMNLGMSGYITKPFKRSDIEAVLNQLNQGDRAQDRSSGEEGGDSSTPSFDYEDLLDTFMGSIETVKRVISSYSETVPKQLKELQESLLTGDIYNIQLIAHSIKGSSYTLSLREYGDLAEKLEHAAQEGDSTPFTRLIGQLTGTWPMVEALIEPYKLDKN